MDLMRKLLENMLLSFARGDHPTSDYSLAKITRRGGFCETSEWESLADNELSSEVNYFVNWYLNNTKALQLEAISLVIKERERQDTKFGADRNIPMPLYLAILTEEVGELAQAVVDSHFGG